MTLHINNITNSEEFDAYLLMVSSFEIVNPFYAVFGATVNDDDLYDSLHYFSFSDDSGKMLILMPFILREVPYQDGETTYYDVVSPYGYSGPLYNESMSRGYLIAFWEHVDAWYRQNNVVSEFIRFSLNHNHQFYSGILVPTLTNVRGKLLRPDLQWQSFKQKVRNNYRKSKEGGLEAKFFTHDLIDDSNIKCFYDIYTDTMKRIGADANYFYSFNYFKNLIKLSKNNFVLVLIYKDDIPISGEIILISGDTLYSYLGGTLSDYFEHRPNDFLKLEVMTWAYNNNYSYYLLGGGRKDGDSLYQYKKSFFASDTDVIYYTGRKIVDTFIYEKLDRILNINVDIEGSDMEGESGKKNFFPYYRRNVLNK
jgi:hypothetical protein